MQVLWRAWSEAFLLIFTKKFFLRSVGPVIVSLLLVCGGFLLDVQYRTEWSFEAIGSAIAFYLLFVEFSVTCMRTAYSPKGSATFNYLPTRRTMRFAATLLMFLLAATLILTVAMAVNTIASQLLLRRELPSSWVMWVTGLGLFYIFSRLVIVLPLIALDKEISFDLAWKSTKGVQWPLFITSLASFLPLMFAWPSIEEAIANHAPDLLSFYLIEIAYWPLNYAIQAFTIAAWVVLCKNEIAKLVPDLGEQAYGFGLSKP